MPDLDYKKFTLARVDAFIKQIQLVRVIPFPYDDSDLALDKISEHIIDQRNRVNEAELENGYLQSRCARATRQLVIFQRFLGYITNSAHPLSSFEIYSPFRRLAQSILGNNIKLIISSEWENYSPVNFTIRKELFDFVFIGLPVSETENPLIVPLSGHELGHSIWNRVSLEEDCRVLLTKSVSSKFKGEEVKSIIDISLIKCEEYFCDCIGIGLFGESYLYAYSYLLAPYITQESSSSHPNAAKRASAMDKAATAYGYQVPGNYSSLFKTQIVPSDDPLLEYLEETERLSFEAIDLIIDGVKEILTVKKVLYEKSKDYQTFIDELLAEVPISGARSLADITNASWDVYFEDGKWTGLNNLEEERKVAFLHELTLKSFEILEINQRLGKL